MNRNKFIQQPSLATAGILMSKYSFVKTFKEQHFPGFTGYGKEFWLKGSKEWVKKCRTI